MNIRVEAGPLTLTATVVVVKCIVHTQINSEVVIYSPNKWACFTLTPSINGHSISSINPELALIGGMTTLSLA